MPNPLLRLILLVVLAFAAPALHAQRELLTPEEIEFVEANFPGTKKTGTGIRYIIQREGEANAASPKPGDRVGVHYTGTLLKGQEFDKRLPPDDPLSFRVARGDVIVGWDQIVQMMKPGEKRLVIIPASLAYGSRGRPPSIPRDSTLVFVMELASVTKPQ